METTPWEGTAALIRVPDKSWSLGLQHREAPFQFSLDLLSVGGRACVSLYKHRPWHLCGGQETTCKSQLSSFSRWIWGIKLGSLGLGRPVGPETHPSKKSKRHYKFQIRHLHS